MYTQVLFICLLAQFQCFHVVQPLPKSIQKESSSVNKEFKMLSLINHAGNCTAYAALKSNFPSYSNNFNLYCDRPIHSPPDANGYIDYDMALCMVLYDAALRVCKMKDQEVKLSTEEFTNTSRDVFCDKMNKSLPEPSSEKTRPWVSILKVKFENSYNCEQACLQGNLINPICMYILTANKFTVTNNVGKLLFSFYCYTCAGFYPCPAAC
jgi:hypothetical protein